jgi:hypothetical protein
MNYSAAKQGLGQTSLLLSYASKGDVDAVKQLLDEGASANASDYDGRTALHLAASEGHVPVVELLLQQGVDVNPVDRWGDTPLADSRKYTKGVVSNILESHGGRIEDNKKHGAVFDMDPSAHYEIDRSELEPMEHIPPLSKVRHFPQHYCLLYEELLIRPWTLLVFPCKAWEKTIVAAGKQFLEKILWKFLADLTVWPHWWVCIVDVL